MIALNAPAPDFESLATDGRTVRLRDFRGRTLVLYFFPRAFTPGCSREADLFREAYPEISALGAEIIGVSTDDHRTQCDFAADRKVPFPMVGDADGTLSRRFDVIWPLLKSAQRVTFVIDGAGVIRGIFHHELRIGQHSKQVLQLLKAMKAGA